MASRIFLSFTLAAWSLSACASTGLEIQDISPNFGKIVAYLPVTPPVGKAQPTPRRPLVEDSFPPLIEEPQTPPSDALKSGAFLMDMGGKIDLLATNAPKLPNLHNRGLGNAAYKIANLGSPANGTPSFLAAFEDVPGKAGWVKTRQGFLHKYSGMVCEKSRSVAGPEGKTAQLLQLSGLVVYDRKGYDTSCHYKAADDSIFLSFYASYWPQISLTDHLNGAVNNMNKKMSFLNVLPILIASGSDKDGNPQGTIEGPTQGAGFSHLFRGRSAKSGIWLNKTDGWHIKEWATFPKDQTGTELNAALYHLLTLTTVDATINSNNPPAKPDQTDV